MLNLFWAYLQLSVPSLQKRREGRVFPLRFHWKRCWRNRLRLLWSCHLAFGHRAEFHAPGSTTPNTHYQSALLLGRHELRYTHAVQKKSRTNKQVLAVNATYKHWQNLGRTYSSHIETSNFWRPYTSRKKRLYLTLTHSLNHETKKSHWKNSISVKSKQFKLRKHIKLACICSSKISYPGISVIILFSSQ